MINTQVIEIEDDSNEGLTPEESASQLSGDKESQSTMENNLGKMKKIAAKLSQQYRRLKEKKKVLQTKQDTRLKDVDLLHRKLLSSWKEKIKSQNEFDHQYMHSIETSQAVWQSMMSPNPLNKHKCSSHGLTENMLNNKDTNQRRKVEKLAKDLLEVNQKRLKTLEEVVNMLTQELEEAKTECLSLDKELAETTLFLEETADILNNVKDCDDDESATFISCGMSILSDDDNQPRNTESYTYKTMSETRTLVVEKKSSTLYPSFVRETVIRKSDMYPEFQIQSNNALNQQSPRARDRRQTFPTEGALYQDSLSPKNADKDTDDEYSNSSVYEIPHYHKKKLGLKRVEPAKGQTTARSDGTTPKKRGRPRKYPIMVQNQENSVKKKRGRPRKYLKLELHEELPGVMKQM